MKRNVVAILAALLSMAAVFVGTYMALSAAAAHIPPGRQLGLIGALLTLSGGLVCAAIGFIANKWARRRPQ